MPIPSNTNIVTSTGQLANNVVETPDIKDGAVTPAKISNGTTGDVLTMGASAPAWTAPASIPAGVTLPYAGTSAPTGYLLANGAVVSQATYPTLYALIGHTYAADPGGGNFTLPDLRGRVPVGKNAATFSALGGTGGEETHVLTSAEGPAHTHSLTVNTDTSTGSNGQANGLGAANSGGSVTTGSSGSGTAHNNLQPYITLNYIIKT